MNATKPPGHIHAGKEITPGGRYDRFLTYLRAHQGATTREIDDATGLCAISALASEIRAVWKKAQDPSEIKCVFVGLSPLGARIHRYYLIEDRKAAAPVAQQETQPEGAGITPSAVKQEDLWQHSTRPC